MTDLIKPRHTLTTEVLHLIEDRTWGELFEGDGRGASISRLVSLTEKSETSIRKAVKELLAGGFIENDPVGKTARYLAVRKADDDEPKEVKNIMADATTTTGRGRPKDPAVEERDGKVIAVIAKTKEGATVAEIAEQLSIEKNAAYLSVWRLSRGGQIVKTLSGSRAPRWTKVA